MDDLNKSDEWEFTQKSKEEKEIDVKMQRIEDYSLFKKKLIRDICWHISQLLVIVIMISVFFVLVFELYSVEENSLPGSEYLVNGIINLLTVSPIHLRIFLYVLITVGIIFFIIMWIYPVDVNGDD